jgi:TonB family protein
MTALWRIWLAVALSVGLHGALVFGLSPAEGPSPAAQPLVSTERLDVELLSGASRLAKEPSPEPRTRRQSRSSTPKATRLKPLAAAAQVEEATALPAASASPVARTEGPTQVSADTLAAVTGVERPLAAEAPGGGPNLGAFVERLKRSAQRCSPRRLGHAAEASLARVRFCVDPLGRPETVTLLQSTGDPRLDRAAVECVIPGAAPLPATDSCLVVPLRFNL